MYRKCPSFSLDSGRNASVTSLNTSITSTRRTSLIPSKKESPSITRQSSINSIASISSQSSKNVLLLYISFYISFNPEFNQSISSTTSIEDNHTETTSNTRKSSKIAFKSSSTSIAKVSHSANLDSGRDLLRFHSFSKHLFLQIKTQIHLNNCPRKFSPYTLNSHYYILSI